MLVIHYMCEHCRHQAHSVMCLRVGMLFLSCCLLFMTGVNLGGGEKLPFIAYFYLSSATYGDSDLRVFITPLLLLFMCVRALLYMYIVYAFSVYCNTLLLLQGLVLFVV